jgi:adenylate cyclase
LGNVGSPERREFTAIGDAIDLSKLLQENAHRGEILLSEATYTQVSEDIDCEPLEPTKTKGRADFTRMYRVIGEKTQS